MTKEFFQKTKKYIRVIILLVIIAITVNISLSILNTPATKSLELSSEEFSAESAFRHLEVIAEEPHPVESKAKQKVRDYIIWEIDALGLEAMVQRSFSKSSRRGKSAQIENVLTRIKGYDNSKAVLVLSHYDSVPEGPGASDDGVAVAAMLDSLKILQEEEFKNDIIFLFTDGEESGLLGAEAFVARNPWKDDVGLVLNFEARGTSGPSIMFETSSSNGFLIRHFAKAADTPLASSFSYEVYKRMSNDTDFSIFNKEGIPGLNFAFIGDGMYYHTKFDNIENIDLGSLQHHGEYIVSLVNHFGNIDISSIEEEDRVFFTIPGKILVHYPVTIVFPLLIFIIVLFLMVLKIAINKKIIGFRKLIIHFCWITVLIPATIFLNYIFWQIAKNVLEIPAYQHYFYDLDFTKYLFYSKELFYSFVITAFLSIYILYIIFRKKFDLNHLTIASLIWIFIYALITGLFLEGISYLFAWPLALALTALIIIYQKDYHTKKSAITIPALLCFLGIVVLLFPILILFNEAMGYMLIPLLGMLSPVMLIIIPHLYPVY